MQDNSPQYSAYTSPDNNLIIIDTNLSNYQSLIPDTNNNPVLLIDSQDNGIEQITAALEKYSNLDSIQIFSHGNAGLVQLGNTNLAATNLDIYQNELAAWGNALSSEGDLLFYGCNVGASGEGLDFVNQVAEITGADVAASNDLTGNTVLGGDWTLEIATGIVETKTFTITEYGHLLDLQINFTYDEGIIASTKTAFEFAGKMWSNVLDDNATINIHVTQASHNELPDNVLAGAVPSFVQGTNYNTVRNSLVNDRTTGDDYTAVNSLETSSTWQTSTSGGVQNLSAVALTRANAKALDLINPHSNELDGIITINTLWGTGVRWENHHTQSVSSTEFDMGTVAMHEIAHILGFVSAVDAITVETQYDNELLAEAATSFDLFRYIGSHGRDMRTGWAEFSIDGGTTALARMSEGALTELWGDGYQASHWRNEDNAGIMDPVAELGLRRSIEDLDLKALDVIGWDRIASTKSANTLFNEGYNVARNKGNINRNMEVDIMLDDWRWARRGRNGGRLAQTGNITQFLAQEGFFNVGAFRESFDFNSISSQTATTQASDRANYLWDNFLTIVRDKLATQELNSLDLDSFQELLRQQNNIATNENEMVSSSPVSFALNEWLSSYEGTELTLEELLQDSELLKSLVADLISQSV